MYTNPHLTCRRILFVLACGNWLICFPSSALPQSVAAERSAEQEVDYARDLAPLLVKNCLACHNAKNAEGGLDLESHEALMRGGDSGDTVVPEDLEASYLLARVTGEEEIMPPADNSVGARPLTDQEIELLKRWISAGAPAPEISHSAAVAWQRIPEQLQPIYAIDSSPDGAFTAFGIGNLVKIVERNSQGPAVAEELVDPALQLPDASPLKATHLDIVQSIAFSPDSQRVATGGYRNIKIWRKQLAPHHSLKGLPASTAAVLSTDGRYAAYTIDGTDLELVDIAAGQAHRFLQLHGKPIKSMVWLPGGNSLLSWDESGKLLLTNASDYQTVEVELTEPTTVTRLSAIGERVFGIDEQGKPFELQVDVETNEARASIRQLGDATDVVALDGFVRDDQLRLLLAGHDGVVRIIDPDSGAAEHTLEVGKSLRAAVISPDGGLVACLPDSGVVQLWRLEEAELVAELDRDYQHLQLAKRAQENTARQKALLERLTARVPELQAALDKETEAQKKLEEERTKAADALAASQKEVEVASKAVTESESALSAAEAAVAEAMKQVETLKTELEAKKKSVAEVEAKQTAAETELAKREQALATASDGVQRAAAKIPSVQEEIALEQKQLDLLEQAAERLQENPPGLDANLIAFAPDGQRIFVAGHDNTLRCYAATGQPLANLQDLQSPVAAVRLTTTGDLVTLTRGGELLTWDTRFPWRLEHALGSIDESPFSDRITAIDFSPDGKTLAVGSGPPSRFGDVHLLDVSSGQIARSLGELHSDTVLSVTFSPDGRWLATGGADKLCKLIDVSTGKIERALEGHTHHVLSIAWHDAGERLATASADNTIKLWKVSTGEQERTISDAKKEVTSVEFVGQTSQLVGVAADGTARLYNADDGKVIRAFAGASQALFSVDVTSDGDWITSGGQAGKLWTWKASDGQLAHTIEAPTEP